MGRVCFVGIVTALMLHATRSAVAHHSFSAEYDEKKPLKLTGTVSEMRWSNRTLGFTSTSAARTEIRERRGKTGGANALYRRGGARRTWVRAPFW